MIPNSVISKFFERINVNYFFYILKRFFRARTKIETFACNWCSYDGIDLAGLSRLQFPPNARIIRTMCSGQVKDKFVLHAFKLGAPIVLVSGCHFADCHYIDANRWTQKRIEKLWDKLEKLGIRPERLQLEWVSAVGGQKWSKVMKAVEEMRQKVTKEEVEFTKKVLSEDEKPKVAKAAKEKVAAAAAVPAKNRHKDRLLKLKRVAAVVSTRFHFKRMVKIFT